MNRSRLLGALCACVISVISVPSNAALIGRLPMTEGGTDWQAYYDDQLGITWATDTRILGSGSWSEVKANAAALTLEDI